MIRVDLLAMICGPSHLVFVIFPCNSLKQRLSATLKWTQVTFTGEIACRFGSSLLNISLLIPCRYHHGAIVYQDSMFVFGGKGDMGPANAQLLQFDFGIFITP